MEITSGLNDFQNRVYLDRISRLVRDLSSTSIDSQLFVNEMVSLSKLLSSLHRKLDKSIPSIDKNALDPAYFIARVLRHDKFRRCDIGIPDSKVLNKDHSPF